MPRTIWTSGEDHKPFFDRSEERLKAAKRKRVVETWRALRDSMPPDPPPSLVYEDLLRAMSLLKVDVELRL